MSITTNQPNIKTARVFVFEQTKQAVNGAEQYGKIQYLFASPGNARSSIWETDKVAEEIIDALHEHSYQPDVDYICISGHVVSLAILIATVVAEYGCFRALLFDTVERNYIFRELGYVD